jgi:hypothetical protein
MIIWIVRLKPEMQVDSWGNPDPGEVCDWACFALLGIGFALAIIFIGVTIFAAGIT